MAGFVFTRQAPAGKWGAATYALQRTTGEEGHRVHRGHEERPPQFADAPYAPYADGNRDTDAAHPSTDGNSATARSEESNGANPLDANRQPAPNKTRAPGWSMRL